MTLSVSTSRTATLDSPAAGAAPERSGLDTTTDIEIVVDRVNLTGSMNLVVVGSVDEGTRVLAQRAPREDLAPDPALPEATRLWAVLQDASGGTWGGCVFDVEAIRRKMLALPPA